MNRLKLLILFLISLNLIFAAEVKSDSLHWKTNSMFDYANEKTDDTDKTDSLTDIILLRSQMIHVPNIAGNSLLKNNPLKRQGLFYSSDKNLKFPPNEECVGFGCCFIPLTGCTMIGHNIFAKDTTKRDTTHVQVSKRKWSFGIGYTGGVCYTGDDLVAAPKEEFDLNPLRLFYWLNSLEASVYYPVTQKSAIEVGLSYGWTHLSDRSGWFEVIYPDNEMGYLQGMNSCNIKNIILSLNKIFASGFLIGGEIIYGEGITTETLTSTSWEIIRWSTVVRRCLGAGFVIKYSPIYPQRKKINILPFISFKISSAYEIWNNSPWNEYWNQKLFLGFSGIYIGIIKLNNGGAR